MKVFAILLLAVAVARADDWWAKAEAKAEAEAEAEAEAKPEWWAWAEAEAEKKAKAEPEAEKSAYFSMKGKITTSAMKYKKSVDMSWEDYVHFMMYKKMKAEKMKKMMMEKEKNKKYEMFESMLKGFDEKKHHLLFTITMKMLEFCQCSELSTDMNMMFSGKGMDKMGSMNDTMKDDKGENEMDYFLKLVYGEKELDAEVLGKIRTMKKEHMKKMAFGGLVKSLCWKSKSYITHMKAFKTKVMDALGANDQMSGGMS